MTHKQAISPQLILTLYAEIAKLITSSLDISTIINTVMRQIEIFFQPTNWSFLRLDPDTNELYFVVVEGIDANLVNSLRLKLGEGLAGYVAKTGKSMIVLDVEENIHFSNMVDQVTGFKTKSLIVVPVIFQNNILGVIELVNLPQANTFTENDLKILETIADFSAIAINNAINHEKITFLATHDPLTKLYNRAFYDKLLKYETVPNKISAEQDTYLMVILFDIDKFKEINDHFGHADGDKVLIRLAELLRECCRKSDYAFRFGGDEFLLVITNLEKNEIPTFEKTMRMKLSSLLKINAPDFSFSYGIATGKSVELESVIIEADKKMYQLKQSRHHDTRK